MREEVFLLLRQDKKKGTIESNQQAATKTPFTSHHHASLPLKFIILNNHCTRSQKKKRKRERENSFYLDSAETLW
jgi:hypothetical protein